MKNKTPLHYAAENNTKEMVELFKTLIKEGAEINAKDIYYSKKKIDFRINYI